MKVLITGVAGFIGMHVAQRLLAQGVAVWSLPAAGGERVDLPALLTRLATDAQINEVLVEAGMGLAGALAQGLFRNPLADPYLLGSASGASLGVGTYLSWFGGSAWAMSW